MPRRTFSLSFYRQFRYNLPEIDVDRIFTKYQFVYAKKYENIYQCEKIKMQEDGKQQYKKANM
jgi:hypothetical protein